MKNIENYIIEYEADNLKAIHLLTRPHYVEKDGYKQSLSFQAFFNNEDKKVSGEIKKTIKSFEMYKKKEVTDKFLEELKYDKNMIINHNSIWSFYDYIGYDYKKQKDKNFKL